MSSETHFGFDFDFVRLSFRQFHQAVSLLESLSIANDKAKLFESLEKAFALCVASYKPTDESDLRHPLDVLTLPQVTRVVGLAIAANSISEDERKK